MIKKLYNRLRSLKISTQLLLLLAAVGLSAVILYDFLWMHKWEVYGALSDISILRNDVMGPEGFLDTLVEEAPKYNLPDSEEDEEGIEAIRPFLALADKYTSLYLYDHDNGLYITGTVSEALINDPFYDAPFDLFYRLTNGEGERSYNGPIKFRNGYADVYVLFYHSARFVFLWFLFSFSCAVLYFIVVFLYFIRRKMKAVLRIKNEILRMSAGDLEHPLPQLGGDEIGILAHELDQLRLTLSSTIRREQESRLANQDLITAMSHDLRTPLTVLHGYLEVIKLGRNPDMQAEYLDRCLARTEDIQTLTDRMFEYALAYEENEDAQLEEITLPHILDALREHCEYLRLTGFETCLSCADDDTNTYLSSAVAGTDRYLSSADDGTDTYLADATMLARVFSNLVSNIIKYGNKKEPVIITGSTGPDGLHLSFSNAVRTEYSAQESNHIGLKSVSRMAELMHGDFRSTITDGRFLAELILRRAISN